MVGTAQWNARERAPQLLRRYFVSHVVVLQVSRSTLCFSSASSISTLITIVAIWVASRSRNHTSNAHLMLILIDLLCYV